jgi:Lon protease-like protein
MKSITANELKIRGISSIEGALQEDGEAIITVRGQERYVVMNLDAYNKLRVCELEAALYETRQQLTQGDFVDETVDEHIARVTGDRE